MHVWSKMEKKYVENISKTENLHIGKTKAMMQKKKIVLHEIRYIGLEKLSAFIGDIRS